MFETRPPAKNDCNGVPVLELASHAKFATFKHIGRLFGTGQVESLLPSLHIDVVTATEREKARTYKCERTGKRFVSQFTSNGFYDDIRRRIDVHLFREVVATVARTRVDSNQ